MLYPNIGIIFPLIKYKKRELKSIKIRLAGSGENRIDRLALQNPSPPMPCGQNKPPHYYHGSNRTC
jgi:hypothetical protein